MLSCESLGGRDKLSSVIRSSYRFGEYRVDPALREFWRGERLIALPPQVFDCLTYLIERRDRAVGRDELVAAVWGKSEISDTLLGQTVLRIRRELGDDAKDPRILRTIPRFGYRWVAPLDVLEPIAAGGTPPIQPPRDESSTAAPTAGDPEFRKAFLIGATALVFAALAGLSFWALRSRESISVPAMPAESLTSAVMPANIAEGTEWAWMRLGLMDVVAARLRGSGLPSVPSENIVALLNAPAATRSGTTREALGARLLVTPSVQHVGGDWEVALDADDVGQHYAVEARSREPTEAARLAADKLLAALGREAPGGAAEAMPEAILVKRVDAAVLADDPDGARKLIAQASPEEQQSPELRLRLAKLDFRAGRLDAARERLAALLEEAPVATSPVLRASVLNGLGAVAIRDDKPQQAEKTFAQAIGLLESSRDPAQLGQAYLGRAAAAADQRRFDDATADYARARIALRQANDTLALIRVAADEGFVDLDRGRPAQALPQLVAATEGFKQWGALNEAIQTYVGQIGCYLALLENRSAMQAADAANVLAQNISNASTLASLTLARARALAAVGRLHESRDLLDQLRRTSTDEVAIAAAGGVLARLDLNDLNNNAPAAADLAERSVAVLAAPSYARLRAEAWLTEIRASLRAGDRQQAGAAIAALDRWSSQADEPRAQLFARLAQAEYALRFGDGSGWRSSFDAAREAAAKGGVPYEIATVAGSYANALFDNGAAAAAAVEVGRVSRWSEQDFDCAVLEARLYAALGHNEARQTAVARARALAGERSIPVDVLRVPISSQEAAR